MIITCTKCSTKYNLADESIPKDGKNVKCTKCKHVWFQEGNSAPNNHLSYEEDIPTCPAQIWLKLVAIVFFAFTVFTGVFVFQERIAAKAPFFESFYEMIGLPLTSQMALNDVVVYEKGSGVMDVNGFVINYAQSDRRVPPILVSFIDDKDQLITRLIQPPVHYLKPNEKYPFYKMLDDLPQGTHIASVEIADKLYMLISSIKKHPYR